MINSDKFWDLVHHFMDVIHGETGFPVLIYDTHGFIVRATDSSRIGDLHAGAKKIMEGEVGEYSVTAQEAGTNPLVREGHSCPILVDGKILAGFGITGKLELAKPVASIAVKMINSWIDIHRYQEQLARSERKYRSVFNHTMHGIFLSTLEGKMHMVNPAAAQLLGYPSPDELISFMTDIPTQLYADSSDRQQYLSILQEHGRVSNFSTRFRKRNGDIIDVKINASLIYDADTQQKYIQGIIEDVTEIKRAQETIRLSEEKYSKAFNNSPVWVVLSSLETGRLIEVNENYLTTTGFSREEVIGRTSAELGTWMHPEDRLHIINNIKEYGKIANYEVRRKTKTGAILTMLFHAEIIEIGNEPCLLSVSLDISDRKKMEESLRTSENNLRITLNSIGDGVIATNTDAIITKMNPMAERLTGWPAEKAIGRPLSEVYTVVDGVTGKKAANTAEKLLRQGISSDISSHSVLINRAGAQYQIEDTCAPIRNNEDAIEGAVLVFRDVTESYLQTRRIQESERLLNNVTANIPGVVFQVQARPGEKMTMGYVSQKFRYYFGIDPERDGLLDAFTDNIALEDRDRFFQSISLAATGYRAWQFKGRYNHPMGKTIWFSGNAIPQKLGNKIIFYGVLLDITEQKQAESDAERLQMALTQAQKMEAIGALAGGIAHDFNNILTAVVGYAQLSLMQPELGTKLQDNLERIMSAGIRAKDLVGQILTFSRQKKLELIPLQMGPLIKESVKLMRASLPSTIELSVFVDNDLPNIMADPTQIHQIIMNLSTNAAHAIENSIGTITIRLSQVSLQKGELETAPDQSPGYYLKLQIEDSGKGIPADNLHRIFDPYFTTKGKDEGTGLGLSVVHGIVKEYNGAIEVTSASGAGTVFSVYLPAADGKGGKVKEILDPIPTGSESILMVDDEIDVLRVGSQMLEKLGYSVTTCMNGHEAIERYLQDPHDIDLVITDLTMPKMTGTELAAKLHEIDASLPVIFWSGYSSIFSQNSVQSDYAKSFLLKPILPRELGILVRRVLDNRSN